jgi:hypothetical protein
MYRAVLAYIVLNLNLLAAGSRSHRGMTGSRERLPAANFVSIYFENGLIPFNNFRHFSSL